MAALKPDQVDVIVGQVIDGERKRLEESDMEFRRDRAARGYVRLSVKSVFVTTRQIRTDERLPFPTESQVRGSIARLLKAKTIAKYPRVWGGRQRAEYMSREEHARKVQATAFDAEKLEARLDAEVIEELAEEGRVINDLRNDYRTLLVVLSDEESIHALRPAALRRVVGKLHDVKRYAYPVSSS